MPRTGPARRPSRPGSPRVSLAWLVMFAVALALRVGWAWSTVGTGAAAGSDSATYDAVAWNLAGGAGYSLDSAAGLRPTALVPPVAPWLTSLLYQAVGHRYLLAVLLQCLIGALVPLLLAALGRSLFGDPVGRWGGWIAAVHPLLIVTSGELGAETTFCATLLLALCLSTEWVRTPRHGRALGVGLAWGLAALTMPTALPLVAIVAAWAWRPLGLTIGGGARARQLSLVLVGLTCVVGPWTLRNAVALRAFVPVSSGAGVALEAANNPAAWDHLTARDGGDRAPYPPGPAHPPERPNEIESDALAGDRAWTFIRSRPADWPAVALAKVGGFWRPGGAPATAPIDPLAAWSIVTFPFALWGIARSLRGGRRWFQSLPLLVILHFMLVAVVFVGSPRARLPAEPLVALLAALGLEDVRRRLRARRHGLTVVPGFRGDAESREER